MDGNAVAYAASNDQRIRALIASARQHAQQGRGQDAARLVRQAEMENPHHPLVMNETAMRLLGHGRPAEACGLLEQATRAEPSNPEAWFNLAKAYRALDRIDEALEAIERSLAIDARSLAALLEKAALEELQCKPRAAAMTYHAALQLIPPGFKPPPWMDDQIRRARDAVDANSRALEAYVEDGLSSLRARHRGEKLQRFDRCVDTLLQKRRIWRQQPTFMFFPELPAIEFYDRAQFPWLDAIDAAADDIRAELLDVLSDGVETLDPYVRMPGNPMDQWRELNHSRRWGVYSLWREGTAFPEHIARCPRTVAALEHAPRWDVPRNGPTALFSILDAKSRIPAHTGPVNTRLVIHLPLIVPPGCGFRVGGQERQWEPGKAFVFDDSINHEAWNDSDTPRAVLIFDIWSPFLSPAEREMVRALTERVGEYYGTFSNSGGI